MHRDSAGAVLSICSACVYTCFLCYALVDSPPAAYVCVFTLHLPVSCRMMLGLLLWGEAGQQPCAALLLVLKVIPRLPRGHRDRALRHDRRQQHGFNTAAIAVSTLSPLAQSSSHTSAPGSAIGPSRGFDKRPDSHRPAAPRREETWLARLVFHSRLDSDFRHTHSAESTACSRTGFSLVLLMANRPLRPKGGSVHVGSGQWIILLTFTKNYGGSISADIFRDIPTSCRFTGMTGRSSARQD
jgi:hypothetical protein